jgi:hypothetical protein
LIRTEHSGKSEMGRCLCTLAVTAISRQTLVVGAFERVLEKLVVDRRDPKALVVAKHIVTFARAG